MKPFVTSFVVSAVLGGIVFAQSPHYTVTDLGPVGGSPGQPFSLNNFGLIAGVAGAAGGTQHAVLWYRGLKGDIGAPGLGGPNSVAYGDNERGQVVGEAETTTVDPEGEDFCGFKALGLPSNGITCMPFLWEYGVMIALPTLGGNNGTANKINNRGEVGGFAENSTLDPTCPAPQKLEVKPVLWERGKVHELPTFGGDREGGVFAINQNGQAAGASGPCSPLNPNLLVSFQPIHALLWDTGTVTDLGNLGGTGQGGGNFAFDLNDKGQVIGSSDLAGDMSFHAFLWTKETGMQDLGALPGDPNSVAVAMNERGDVVGLSADAMFNPRAFLWSNGAMHDLNSMIPANSPLYLLLACSINSRGQIIGLAFDASDNSPHGYMATPSGEVADESFSPDAKSVNSRPPLSDDVRKLLRGLRFGRF